VYENIISTSFSNDFAVMWRAAACSQQRQEADKNSDSKAGSYQAQAREGNGVLSQHNGSYGILTFCTLSYSSAC
jgi:hypothetical protein